MNIENWLNTELGIKIWENKYRYNNESLDQWFDRVSGNNKDIKQLIKDHKFLFGGRTLNNRGLNNGSYSNCFIPGTKVLTKNGYKNIEDIKVGDLVLTKDNTYQIVNDTFKNYYEGNLIVFNSSNLIDTIKCTPNHKFLTNRGWVSAEEIKDVAKYQSPKNYKLRNSFKKIEEEDVLIDLFELLHPICDRLAADNKHVWLNRTDGKRLYDNAIIVNRYIRIDSELKYLFGRYLGDGSITNNKTLNQENYIFQIVFNNETEIEDYIKCKNIINSHFGNICTDNSNEEQNTAVIKINSSIVGEFFNFYCGKKENKHFPDQFKNDINIAIGLLDSDGSVSKTGGIRIWLKLDTLMKDLYNCLINNNLSIPKYTNEINNKNYKINKLEISKGASINLIPLMSKKYSDDRMLNYIPKTKQYYEITDATYINIWDITEELYCGYVYNISVEVNHDYIVNGVNVHNCYSSGYVEDSLEEIMKVNTNLAFTYKAEGGQGVSLSKIRPKGCLIKNRYESDGIVPFMELFNTTTASLKQGGSRKGALMISIDITHKEAETFITIKSDLTKINNANLSVEIDDDFMKIVEESYKSNTEIKMNCIRKYGSQTIEYEIIPIKLYKLLIKQAHLSAEPGVLFVNRFRNYNLMEFCDDYQIENCNPCGEQPLPKNGACNLGSINLSKYVTWEDKSFKYNEFVKDVKICIRALDEIIDENLNNHALIEQKEMSYNYRNVGLGIMGFADMFIKLGIIYGSEESLKLTDKIMKLMLKSAVEASVELAVEKGSFPKYRKELFDSTILKNIFTESELEEFKILGIRNCSLLSIAPTGSLGTMFNISTGIEPNFALEYIRKTESLENNKESYHKVFAGIAEEYTKLYNTTELPDYFVTSHNINWRDRIKIQAVAQNYIDTAISATINLPENITVSEVEDLYLEAWKLGLKGVTIYRDNCRKGILSLENTPKQEDNFFERGDTLKAKVVHFNNEGIQWIAFIGIKNNKPFEIFSGPSDMELFPIPKSIKEGEIIKVKSE